MTETYPARTPSSPRSPRPARKTLPAALLVEGRMCLVIGGGTVAGRKAEALLDAGAEVVLVASDLGEHAERLRDKAGMTLVRREYVPEDLDRRPFLVITATNESALNRQVLHACHARGILCACPDSGWDNGDLISPATFKHGDLTVSVSTGGASCRRSRLIRDSLARHAEALGQADLLVTGTDHRFAVLTERECLHLAGTGLTRIADELRQVLGIHEFMLLSTCNRVELVGLATCTPALLSLVTRILGLDRLGERSYTRRGYDAFRHLAFVAAGLLSQTPRETHIRAQVKEALDLSRRNGWSAGILHDWVGRALRIGNEIRGDTGDILTETEIEGRCVAFLAQALGDLRCRRVLVIGSGAVGRNIVKALADCGATVSCCYRTHAPDFARSCGGEVTLWPMEDLRSGLLEQDAIICAVSAAEPVLRAEHASWIDPGHPLLLVDLGVPRNIAPDFAAGRDGVRVANLDDLDQWDRRHATRLQEALAVGELIVKRHVEDYERVMSGIQTGD